MQNPNRNPSPIPPPLSLEDALAQAYARARERMRAADHRATDAANAEPEAPDTADSPDTADPQDAAEPSDLGMRISLDELLCVFREPIEWALVRAELRADRDPVDIAAVHRVRDAFRVRLASIVSGTDAPADNARIRVPDLMTVSALLVRSFDPNVVHRVAHTAGESFIDALATVFQLDPSLASHFAHAAAHSGGSPAPDMPRGATPYWYGAEIPSAAMPFSPASRIPHPVMPLWYWPHIRISF